MWGWEGGAWGGNWRGRGLAETGWGVGGGSTGVGTRGEGGVR